MDATSLYITTCRYIFNADLNNENSGDDLYRLLPYLRQSLSCCVCTKLLNGPMGPVDQTCQHHVCQGCIGGKKRLRPACGWCTDYSQFIEKKQLRILLSCYKKMCEYIADTPMAKTLVGTNGGTSNVLSLLYEGMAINAEGSEDLNSNAPCLDIIALLQSKSNHVPTLTPKKRGRKRKKPINSTIQVNQNEPEVLKKKLKIKTEDDIITTPPTESESKQTEDINKRLVTETTGNSPVKRNGFKMGKHKYKRHSAPSGSLKFMNKCRGRGSLRQFRPYRTKSDSSVMETSIQSAANNYTKTNSNVQKKLIISGRRAKILREGRKLGIQQGCRCGTWSQGSGTTGTCQGRRCPCFMAGSGCASCLCRGCSNPLAANPADDSNSKENVENEKAESTVCVPSGTRSRSNSQ